MEVFSHKEIDTSNLLYVFYYKYEISLTEIRFSTNFVYRRQLDILFRCSKYKDKTNVEIKNLAYTEGLFSPGVARSGGVVS